MVWGMSWRQFAAARERRQAVEQHPNEPALADYRWHPGGFEVSEWAGAARAVGIALAGRDRTDRLLDLLHGLLNIFLAIQLYRDKHWVYLLAVGTMTLSVFYQIYRISIYHSLLLAAFTIFDIFFIALAWHEYKHHKDKIKIG